MVRQSPNGNFFCLFIILFAARIGCGWPARVMRANR